MKFSLQGILPAEYTQMNYSQYWTECMKFAKSLVHLNVDPFKIVNILGFNSVGRFSLLFCFFV